MGVQIGGGIEKFTNGILAKDWSTNRANYTDNQANIDETKAAYMLIFVSVMNTSDPY